MTTEPAEDDRRDDTAWPAEDVSGRSDRNPSPAGTSPSPFSAEQEARVCEMVLGSRRHGLGEKPERESSEGSSQE